MKACDTHHHLTNRKGGQGQGGQGQGGQGIPRISRGSTPGSDMPSALGLVNSILAFCVQ